VEARPEMQQNFALSSIEKKILQIGLVCCWKIIRRKTMVFNYGFNYISITF